ncbi:ABC transporter C family member 9 [Citrus sinensis]|uniref:ABC transporter C family member 9 n=1 Tax=Citrus sinensis TaxID=2711 RepID=A0ACB8MTB8_CITSI|nr:ABC transporter C family member 9 [Citrus sinensis]
MPILLAGGELRLLHFQTAWLPLRSPCFWEHIISIVVQLGFLGLLLLQLARTTLFRRLGADFRDLVVDKYPYGVKLGICYKASMVSSTLIFGTHFIILLTVMLNTGGEAEAVCNSGILAFSSRIMQVVSWASTLFLLCKIIPNSAHVKFPWILRAWWFCSFLFSILCTALHTYLRIRYRGQFRIQDYVDIIALLASTFLFGISIQGKTGLLLHTASSDTTEPFLNVKADKQFKSKRDSPYGKSTLLQLVTFSWLNPLFAVGIKKPLELDDIPDVDIKDSAEFLSNRFEQDLDLVKEKEGSTNPSIYKAIFFFIRKKAAINASFAVINAATSYVGPYLINDFVNFLTDKKSRSLESGYLLALAFLGAKMVETIAQRQWIFGARQLGLRLRAALISHLYRKGLHLSSQSRQSHTSGEIINYMSVDVQRISDFIFYSNYMFMLPVQISLAIYILRTNLGLGSLAALAATLTVMTCNIPITRIQKRFQSKIMDAKDNRMRATSEVLKNMKTLKLQAWDTRFLQKLESLRQVECIWLWKSLRLSATSAFIFWGSPTFISVVTFGACMLLGIQLTAGRVLSALATFRMLQDPIFNLPDLLSNIAQGKVSADRIAAYLQEDEIQRDAVEYVPKGRSEFEVEVVNGKFSWNPESSSPTLDGIQLKVKRGMKVAICGTVGSGKSSLLSCILGEIQKMAGTVKISGTKAYVPQSPWILTGNIRENILFGNQYDSCKYDRTVEACALVKDFELFASGDLTEIGERGINMSGGQKQRIQIARAVYQDADIYLLDDPFSAVDAHTGTQLFKDCLMGILKDKSVLYVTHQVEFLPAADIILVMENGRIAQAGRFEELLKQNIGFEVLVGAHSQALESVLTVETSSRTSQDPTPESELNSDSTSNVKLVHSQHDSEHELSLEITEKGGKLVQEEEREKGSIGKEVYWSYLTAVKGGALVPIILLAQSSFQVLQVASNYWMAWASPPTSDGEPALGMNIVLLVYTLLTVGSSLCVLLRAMLVAITGLRTAQKLFTNMLHSVHRAPMAFFDSTPTGRILNRASNDQSVLDLELAGRLGWCAFSIIQILGTIGVMSQVAWQVFVIFIPVTGICIWYQQYYIPTARELARLAEIQRAPILHHFAESLAGIAGLAVTYGINLNVLQASIIWNICNAENKMISVERILQYSNLPSEAPLVTEECRPPSNWPDVGTISFHNLQIRYAEHLPSVLKNISCTFPGRKKVGVVGRTGSGKSTLIQAIFRIVEPTMGSIIIDNVDITKIGLHDLRSRLGIIPQDPTLFDGTVRGNLDPLVQYSDKQVWEALDKCQLGDLVGAKEEKLDSTVAENGENWSVGQRQLFCLGRTLLKKSSILVLDEATASVDSATDGVIQKIISQEFKDRTVVTIAHRIHTVIDSDLVLVLSDGRIAEYDSPTKLLEREDSFFSQLIKEYSMRSQNFNSVAGRPN